VAEASLGGSAVAEPRGGAGVVSVFSTALPDIGCKPPPSFAVVAVVARCGESGDIVVDSVVGGRVKVKVLASGGWLG